MTRVVFMGTPDFACSILDQLLKDNYDVVAVVSQPDKKVGRKQEIVYSPVKQMALEHNIPVIQPLKIKEDYEEVLSYKPDLIITCAYGQFIPEIVLNAPKYGTVNVHASLLPRLRGGAPIHKAIMFGEEKTGVTLMYTVKKMDAGDMLAKREIKIDDKWTMGDLHDELTKLGADIIHVEIPRLLNGELKRVPQNEDEATVATNVSKEEEFVSFDKDLQTTYDHIRSLIPWPVSYGLIDGKKMKFWGVVKGNEANDEIESGTIVSYEKEGLKVKAGSGYIYLTEIQLEGKGKMAVKDFMNGAGKNYLGHIFTHQM